MYEKLVLIIAIVCIICYTLIKISEKILLYWRIFESYSLFKLLLEEYLNYLLSYKWIKYTDTENELTPEEFKKLERELLEIVYSTFKNSQLWKDLEKFLSTDGVMYLTMLYVHKAILTKYVVSEREVL